MAVSSDEILVCRFRPDATLTFVNEAFCRYFGRSRDELLDVPLYSIVPEQARAGIQTHIESLAGVASHQSLEYESRRADGSRMWREWTLAPTVNAAGRAVEFLAIGRDITSRKRIEQDLQTKNELLEAVAAATRQLLDADDLRGAAGTLLRTALKNTQSEYGFFGVVMDGPMLRMISHEGIRWNAIKSREFYEQALREYEQRGYLEFPNLESLIGAGITSKDTVIANDPGADYRSAGLPPGHLPLKAFLGVPIRSGGNVVGLMGLANRQGGYSAEEQQNVETILQLAGLLCDRYRLAERQQALEEANALAEASIRESIERFEQLAKTVEDVFWLYDCAQQRTIYVSPAFERIWGRSVAHLATNPSEWLNTVVPEDRERVRQAFARISEVRFDETYRITRPDGEQRWVHDCGFPVRDAEGRIVRVAGVAKDITDRKLAEERVLESEQLLRSTLNALPAHIAVLNEDGVIIAVNQAWRQYADVNAMQMKDYGIGVRYLDMCDAVVGEDADTADAVARGVREVVAGRREAFVHEYPCHPPDQKCWYELRVIRFATEDHALAVALHLDVTARKLAEERAYRQQADMAHMGRVAILGEIAAGIAHELNQPLASIMNYAQGGLDRLEAERLSEGELKETLSRVCQLAQKSGDIIRRIRGLSRKGDSRRSTADVNQLVHETLDMLKYEMRVADVRLRLRLANNLPTVHIDTVQMQQVLMNLLLNAIAAVRLVDGCPHIVGITTQKRGRYVEVAVADSGPGFDGVPVERLFEPFFSTKSDGLGLGLAISRSILEQHRGRLSAERVGSETVFRFSLPLPTTDASTSSRLMFRTDGVSQELGTTA